MTNTVNVIKHFKKKLNKTNNMGKLVNQDVIPSVKLEGELLGQELDFICVQIMSNKTPTIETMKEDLIKGVRKIYSNHTLNQGFLTHDCCFSENIDSIIKLIEIVVNKKYLKEQLIHAKE